MPLTEYFKRLPIRHKLVVLMMLCSFSVAFLLSSLFIVQQFFSAREHLAQEVTLLANVVGESNILPLTYDQTLVAQKKLSALKAKQGIEQVCLYYDYGDFFTGYTAPDSQQQCPKSSPPPMQQISLTHISETQTIMDRGYPVGSLYVYSNLDSIWFAALTSAFYTLLFMGVALGLSYALAQLLQRFVAKPITSLVLTTQNLCDSDDYSTRVEQSAQDELGQLIESFNAMIAAIEKRDKAIKAYNQNLEQQVEERTREVMISVEKLNATLATKEKWIANVSHEIRTPVHGMKQFANFGIKAIEACEREGKPLDAESLKRFFDRSLMGANRMNILIENILDFGKLQAGKMTISPDDTNLLDLTQQTREELRHKWEEKHIDVEIISKDPQEYFSLSCDKNQIIQVISNLLSNAIKFSPQHSTITIEMLQQGFISNLTAESHMIGLQIIDHGVGIPDNEQRSIFDSFTQSSRTNTGSGGTGLGLSIAKEIIELHKGHIAAKNNDDGKGACFVLFLPRSFMGYKKRGASLTEDSSLSRKEAA